MPPDRAAEPIRLVVRMRGDGQHPRLHVRHLLGSAGLKPPPLFLSRPRSAATPEPDLGRGPRSPPGCAPGCTDRARAAGLPARALEPVPDASRIAQSPARSPEG